MPDPAEFFFAEKKQAQETRFQKKGEDAFHRQRLADDASRGLRKRSPVRAELKFHGNASDHAEGEINTEDAGPESRSAIVMLVARAQCFGLQIDEQQREAHRELGKYVVERDGEGKVKAMHVQRLSHEHLVAKILPYLGQAGRGLLEGCERYLACVFIIHLSGCL